MYILHNFKISFIVNVDQNTCAIKIVADYEFYSGVGNSLESTVINTITVLLYFKKIFFIQTLDIMMDHIMASDDIYRCIHCMVR